MPIYSMTGYASAQVQLASDAAAAHGRLGLEIRAVNSRFLDLSFKMPDELRAHEAALRERITQALRRGKVEVRVQLESSASQGLQAPDAAWLQSLAQVTQHIQAALPQARALSVADVLRLSQPTSTLPATLASSWAEIVRRPCSTLCRMSTTRSTSFLALSSGTNSRTRSPDVSKMWPK